MAVNGYPGGKTSGFPLPVVEQVVLAAKCWGFHVLLPSFQQTASLRFYLAFWSKCVMQIYTSLAGGFN